MTDVGNAALRVLKLEFPHLSRAKLIELALVKMAEKTAYMQPTRTRRISSDDLMYLAGIVAEAETACRNTFRDIIKAKIQPSEKKELIELVKSELRKLPRLRRTISRMIGIPLNNNYDLDAKDLIEELTRLRDNALSTSQTIYQTGIDILTAYTCEMETDPPPSLTSTPAPTPDL